MQPTPPDDGQDMPAPLSETLASVRPSQQLSIALPASSPDDHTFFYLPNDDEDDEQHDQSAAFVRPFQDSASLPTVVQQNATHSTGTGDSPPSIPVKHAPSGRPFRPLKWVTVIGLVVLTVLLGTILVFAQTASPTTQQGHGIPIQASPFQQKPPSTLAQGKGTPESKTQGTQQQGQQAPQGTGGLTIPVPTQQQLDQVGWTNAGLSLSDAIEAQRTAQAFTEREMSFDYRSTGTPTHHGGTFTGATFLLTPGALSRFTQNDVRVINNVLYNKVHTQQIIQQALVTQSLLTMLQVTRVQGQQQAFAWVRVSFQVWRSALAPNTNQPMQGLERDFMTNQPRIHTMTVLLLRVAPQRQGAAAPMGGTGWLVNSYALDGAILPTIETMPSL